MQSRRKRIARRVSFARPLEPLEARRLLAGDAGADGVMDVGINLDAVTHYTTAIPFNDVFQTSSPWTSHAYNTATGKMGWGDGGPIELNAAGYPTKLKTSTNAEGQTIQQRVSTLMMRDIGDKYPAGIYKASWEGTGTVTFGYAANVVARPTANTADVRVTPQNAGIWLRIDATSEADPVRNIRLYLPGTAPATPWTPGASFSPFYKPFVDGLKPLQTIRFMNWQEANVSTLETWDQRRRVTDARQQSGGKGVAYEYMIQLANETDTDAWVHLPFAANDEFVRNLATMFRDGLEPGRKVVIEWGNESWNYASGFNAYPWVTAQLAKPENKEFDRYDIVGREVERDFAVWMDVWNGQADRVTRLVGGHAPDRVKLEQMIDGMHGNFDAIALTAYMYAAANDIPTWNASTTAQQVIDSVRTTIPSVLNAAKYHAELADEYSRALGRDIKTYIFEGGQSLIGKSAPYQPAYFAAQSHPGMYDLYADLMRGLNDVGIDGFEHFTYVGPNKESGSWGSMLYHGQPLNEAPKYRAVIDAATGALFGAPVLSVQPVVGTAAETGASPASFVVRRVGNFAGSFTASYALGGTASAADYGAIGSIAFAPGERERTVTIRPVQDGAAEGTETLTFTLTPGTGYAVDPRRAGTTVAIVDGSRPVPAAPANLSGRVRFVGSLSLFWADQATDEDAYAIDRRVAGTGAFSQVAVLPRDATQHVDKTVDFSTSYEYRVRAVNAAGTSAPSNVATAVSSGSEANPFPWAYATAGTPGVVGSGKYATGAYTVTGSAGKTAGTESFGLFARAMTGDGEIVARLAQTSFPNAAAFGGVSYRASNSAAAAHVTLARTGAGTLRLTVRTATNGPVTTTTVAAPSTAAWLKVARVGNVVTAYFADAAYAWVPAGGATLPLSSTASVALVAGSGDATRLATARFDRVSVAHNPPRAADPTPGPTPGGTPTTLASVADATVRDGAYASTNDGAGPVITVKKSAAGYTREGLVTFDIASVASSATNATLRLYGYFGGSSGSLGLTAYAASSAGWSEAGVTWNTRPGAGASYGSRQVGTAAAWHAWDVTALVNAARAAGRTAVSVVLKADAANDGAIFLDAREGANRPQLVVTPAAAPASPATATIAPAADATVRGGAYANQNDGLAAMLTVKRHRDATYAREAVLRFDASTLAGTAASATLRLYGHFSGASGTLGMTAFAAAPSTWAESAVTWNTRPAAGASYGSRAVGTAMAWHEWDVTALVNAARAAGQASVSVLLRADAQADPPIFLNSREGANAPQLVVTRG